MKPNGFTYAAAVVFLIAVAVWALGGCVQPHAVQVDASLIDKDGAQWIKHEVDRWGERLWQKQQDESNNRATQVKAASSQPVAAAKQAVEQSKANATALREQRIENGLAWLITILTGLLGALKIHAKIGAVQNGE